MGNSSRQFADSFHLLRPEKFLLKLPQVPNITSNARNKLDLAGRIAVSDEYVRQRSLPTMFVHICRLTLPLSVAVCCRYRFFVEKFANPSWTGQPQVGNVRIWFDAERFACGPIGVLKFSVVSQNCDLVTRRFHDRNQPFVSLLCSSALAQFMLGGTKKPCIDDRQCRAVRQLLEKS